MSVKMHFSGGKEVVVSHADSNKNSQIYMAAEAIWGLTADKLPKAKFEELRSVLQDQRVVEYGSYKVHGFGDVFVLVPLDPSQKSPCSLDTCMVTNAAFKCSKCKNAMYCSKDHQRKDWPTHKTVCRLQK